MTYKKLFFFKKNQRNNNQSITLTIFSYFKYIKIKLTNPYIILVYFTETYLKLNNSTIIAI